MKGVLWSFADNLANSGITFLVGLILARILSPSEFGLIGLISIFIAVSNTLVDSGFSSALIRKVKTLNSDFNTVFYFNLCLSLLLYSVLFFIAPQISRFFDAPILAPITKVMGFVLIINAFGIVQKTLLIKEVDFKTQTKISLSASLISGVIGISMALKDFGVWSLVGQQVSRQICTSILLWVFNTWRPSLEFSLKSFQELFGFGSKLLLSSLIDTLYRNIYYLIIGKFYSTQQLGFYTRADQFNQIFSSNLTAVVQKVSYPILCRIQNDEERLKRAYQRIIKSTMLVAFACMFGLIAIAKPLVMILIGEKWLPSVSYLQILCLAGVLYPLHALNLNILLVKGRSDLFLKLEIIKKGVAIIPIYLGIFHGIEVMLWGSVLVSMIAYLLNSCYSKKLIGYSNWKQLKDICPSLLISVLVASIMWVISFLNMSVWLILVLQCIIGLTSAIILYEIFNLSEYHELKRLVYMVIKKYNT